jgi:hypothetical protein
MKSLATTDNVVNKLIKNYFSLTPLYMNKIFKRVPKRRSFFSVNKIYVSKGEMKHTNNSVILTYYTFNKEKIYFIRKLISLRYRLIFRDNLSLIIKDNKNDILKNVYKVSFLLDKILKKKQNFLNNSETKGVFENTLKENKLIEVEGDEKFLYNYNESFILKTFEKEFALPIQELTNKPQLNNVLKNYFKVHYQNYVRKLLAILKIRVKGP